MNLFEMDIEKYFSFPSHYTVEDKRKKLQSFIKEKTYVASLKTDGNWARFVKQGDEAKIQSRGISTITQTYGELQEKLLFFPYLRDLFTGDTVIIGEIYVPGAIDKDVGAILRCLPPKSLARQKEKPLRFRIFDIYYLNGRSLMNTPMIERVQVLHNLKQTLKHPLIDFVVYFEVDETIFDKLETIFNAGGEGVVLARKDGVPTPGSRLSWKTLKLKRELDEPIDCFIYGIDPPTRISNTTQLSEWGYWENVKTGEKFAAPLYVKYTQEKDLLVPITKNYYYGWCGAIRCAVLDENNEPFIICSCSGLTEEFKEDLRQNYDKYHKMPIQISGMMATDKHSIRHPKLLRLREGDISIEDCTLKKLLRT